MLITEVRVRVDSKTSLIDVVKRRYLRDSKYNGHPVDSKTSTLTLGKRAKGMCNARLHEVCPLYCPSSGNQEWNGINRTFDGQSENVPTSL